MSVASLSLRLFHSPAFSLEAIELTDQELEDAGLMGYGKSRRRFARLFLTYRPASRRFLDGPRGHSSHEEKPRLLQMPVIGHCTNPTVSETQIL